MAFILPTQKSLTNNTRKPFTNQYMLMLSSLSLIDGTI